MNICPRARGFWIDKTGPIVKIGRIRCKSWLCDYCAKINQNILIANTINASEALEALGYRLYFSTLTLAPYAHSTDTGKHAKTAHTAFNRYWHGLRKLTRIKNAVHYARFLERHADGTFHIHAVMASVFNLNFDYASYPDMRYANGTMTRVRHKDLLVRCGLGYQFKHALIEKGHARAAGMYAVKYAAKSVIGGYDAPAGFRRYASSREFALTHKDGPKKAEFVEAIQVDMVLRHTVIDTDNQNHILTVKDFISIEHAQLGPSVDYTR